MSQGFKLGYEQFHDDDPVKKPTSSDELEAGKMYRGTGHARSLCLIWPNNTRMFFNYAYLASGIFSDTDEKNLIKLNFSSHSVQIAGFGLESLFMALLEHTPRIIVAIEERYIIDSLNAEALVTEIVVEEKK